MGARAVPEETLNSKPGIAMSRFMDRGAKLKRKRASSSFNDESCVRKTACLSSKSFNTDGAAVENMAVRIVDDDGNPVPPDTEGRLQAQSVGMFVGYLKRPDAYESYDGWFETGDLARIDADGYIRIVGRAKDIVIRGGENIPVVEVEDQL